MIPAVFVSSTIRDLRYLRDALRDAILELSYQPVMSDYGEVTYIHSGSAAEACFKSVERCHLVVLIVGRRYGELVDGVYGVTHKEFLTAKDGNIPMFAFIEAQVLNYKEVFDTDPKAELWNAFPGMDNARMTFRLIDEIKTAPAFNGLIPFTTAGEAKQMLKVQIADFVGQRLGSLIQPVRNELQELSAEVRTLRKQFTATKQTSPKIALASERYLKTTRFLLEDKHSKLRQFATELTGELEVGIQQLMKASSLDELVKKIGGKIVITPTAVEFQKRMEDERNTGAWAVRGARWSVNEWIAIYGSGEVWIDANQARMLDAQIKALKMTLTSQGAGIGSKPKRGE